MATASKAEGDDGYEPTYRERDVDETLDEHEQRLTRLEKLSFIILGYIAAEAPDIAATVMGFI